MKPLALDHEEALFAVKCLIAAVLAYYVAARIGLSHPYWAVTTAYIVAQPLSGAVLSKAVFRLVGTVVGAAAAVVLVPNFVNQPLVLSAALALWLSLCVYLALIDRTARAYTFLLAGYTASIIGFPSVDAPGHIFNVAILRVQEISIGIVAGSLIHGAFFPRTVTARLHSRIDAIMSDAERWTLTALESADAVETHAQQTRLASDLDELDQLSIHLPFDTARLVPSTRSVRAMQDNLSLMLPITITIGERLGELRRQPGGIPAPLTDMLARIAAWLREDANATHDDEGVPIDTGVLADGLIADLRALMPIAHGPSLWREMLILSIIARLETLVHLHRDCRRLRDRIKNPGWRDGLDQLLSGFRIRQLHRDRGLAMRSALGTGATIFFGCVFWIATAWKDGAQAALIAGITCALMASADRPAAAAFRFLKGFTVGAALSFVYAFAILPRVTDGVVLAAVLAPALLLIGSALARPSLGTFAPGMIIAFPNTVGLNLAYDPSFVPFINALLGQWIGAAVSVVMLGLFQNADPARSIAQIRRACFHDIALRLTGRPEDDERWIDRMLDRINLMRRRAPPGQGWASNRVMDTLRSMRIGLAGGELRTLSREATDAEREHIDTLLTAVARHFRALSERGLHHRPAPVVLDALDRTIEAFDTDPDQTRRQQGLVFLTGLRRNLFPAATGYGENAS